MSASKAKQECRRSRCATPAKTEYSCTRGSFCTVCTIWVSSISLPGDLFTLRSSKLSSENHYVKNMFSPPTALGIESRRCFRYNKILIGRIVHMLIYLQMIETPE